MKIDSHVAIILLILPLCSVVFTYLPCNAEEERQQRQGQEAQFITQQVSMPLDVDLASGTAFNGQNGTVICGVSDVCQQLYLIWCE